MIDEIEIKKRIQNVVLDKSDKNIEKIAKKIIEYQKKKENLEKEIIAHDAKYFSEQSIKISNILRTETNLDSKSRDLCENALIFIKSFLQKHKEGKNITNLDLEPVILAINEVRELAVKQLPLKFQVLCRMKSPIYKMMARVLIQLQESIRKTKYEPRIFRLIDSLCDQLSTIIEDFLYGKIHDFKAINAFIIDKSIVEAELGFIT